MKAIDYATLGFKNIWRRKSRSFLTIFAVMIGAISIIIMLSLVLGAKAIATQQLESIDGLTLISVSPNPEVQSNGNLFNTDGRDAESGRQLNDSVVEELRAIPHVIDATPLASVWVKNIKLEGQEKRYRTNIVAYSPDNKVLSMPVTAGRQLKENDTDKIVIGNEMLRNMGYAGHPEDILGKRVILYTENYVDWGDAPPRPPENADEEYWKSLQKQPHQITAEIVGVITGGPEEGQNYITLNWGRKLMTQVYWKWDDEKRKEYEEERNRIAEQINQEWNEQQKEGGFEKNPEDFEKLLEERMNNLGYNTSEFYLLVSENMLSKDGYNSILVRADSTENIEEVGKNIKDRGFGVQTAKEMLDEIKKIFNMVGMIIGAIGGIVLFVASLGIINNMIMATYERTREIGILRACGATRANIRNMFIIEASTLGFLGGAAGLAASFVLAKILNSIGNSIALSQGVPINNIISFQLWLILGVIGITTIIGTLSGLFPAIRAAHLDPVDALKYE